MAFGTLVQQGGALLGELGEQIGPLVNGLKGVWDSGVKELIAFLMENPEEAKIAAIAVALALALVLAPGVAIIAGLAIAYKTGALQKAADASAVFVEGIAEEAGLTLALNITPTLA